VLRPNKVTLASISNVTTVHVHVPPAGSEVPGTVLLYRGPETGAVDGVLGTGSFRAKDLTGMGWDQFLATLRGGRAYVEVHTTAFPGGEIRGVLRPAS
jgi:hypothetical protein